MELPATPESAKAARKAIETLGLTASMLSDALLLTSELVTNSIKYSGLGPDENIRVTASWKGPVLRIGILDRSGPPEAPVAGAILPSPGATSGWGLFFVDQLSERWGYENGKGYWFELRQG
ncbi:MAG: ATP-binding protein [Actinomycetota bacterium]